jgi:8-oxo-dGTP diphosphatase
MTPKIVNVAAAVITRPDGSFLLGQRGAETYYTGYWEFPGGKVEPGETPHEAVVRELSEELDITVQHATPWLVRRHLYEHAHVTLHFFEVPEWRGEPRPIVHAALAWQQADALEVGPMLPANGPILKALRLPRRLGVTHAHQVGVAAQLAALDTALAQGLRAVVVREAPLEAQMRRDFAREVAARCRAAGALCIVGGDAQLAHQCDAQGMQMTSAQLASAASRPDYEWVGASCHTRADLERAAALELDYAVLGPVLPTASHPDVAALGWEAFHALTRDLPLPVIAIGGLGANDMAAARAAGAHGIAAIRSAWGE